MEQAVGAAGQGVGGDVLCGPRLHVLVLGVYRLFSKVCLVVALLEE